MTDDTPAPPAQPGPAVEKIEVAAYKVPTDRPEADGTLSWNATTLVVVHAAGGGRRGLGWTYTAAAAAALVTEMLSGAVLGRDAFDVPGANAALRRSVRDAGAPGIASCAVSAVDVALWDLKARLLGLPLTALLGRARPEAPVYASGGFTTYPDEHTASQLDHWVRDLGIPRVKIKIGASRGGDTDRDLARVALARDVVGERTDLYVDADGAYTVGQARRVGAALDERGVRWFEEPVAGDDLEGLAAVRAATACDVAAGEYLWDLPATRRMCAAGAVDCLQLDATRCGGYTGFLQGAALAAAHNLQVSAHCAPYLHTPVCCAVPNLRHLEYFHDHQAVENRLFEHGTVLHGGALRPDPAAPGHGVGFLTQRAEPLYAAGDLLAE